MITLVTRLSYVYKNKPYRKELYNMPPFFATTFIILAICITIAVLKTSSTKKNEQLLAAFWEKERAANSTRKQPLDELTFIQIPLDNLLVDNTMNNATLSDCSDTLTRLSQTEIVNLNNQSNTDLKLKYGVANFPMLSACDERYMELVRTLYLYGKALAECGQEKQAITVLEYGISIGTDISGHYPLLASLYQKNGQDEKIVDLIAAAQNLDSLMKATILRRLEEI